MFDQSLPDIAEDEAEVNMLRKLCNNPKPRGRATMEKRMSTMEFIQSKLKMLEQDLMANEAELRAYRLYVVKRDLSQDFGGFCAYELPEIDGD